MTWPAEMTKTTTEDCQKMSEGASHLINPTYPGGTNSSGEQQPGGGRQ